MSLPWSNYATPQKKVTYIALATPYGVVSMPVTAAVVSADPDTLTQDLHIMRMQLETFFGRGGYGDDWWQGVVAAMVVGPEDVLCLSDVLAAIPKVGKYKGDREGRARVYSYVARFLKQPNMWPDAGAPRGAALGATFLNKVAVELVGAATRAKQAPPSAMLTLRDYLSATDHLVMLATTPANDDTESLLMKATLQLSHVIETPEDDADSVATTDPTTTPTEETSTIISSEDNEGDDLDGMPDLID